MTDDIQTHTLAAIFNTLTPEHVLDAVETDGRRATGRFIILNSYENRVYQLELDDDTWVVGKFYRPGRWSNETILAEHQFLAELAAEEIPVAAPIVLANGSTIDEVNGIRFSLFPRVGGRSPQEMNDEQLHTVGRLIARIHNVGARNEAPARPLLTAQTYGEKNLEYLISNGLIPKEVEASYAQTVKALIERIAHMFEGVPVHRIHGDCHMANLIDTGRGMTFLDFDDMVTGPAVQDIWMLVPSFDSHGQRQREKLLEAYSEFRVFNHAWLRLIEPLRALRFIHYSTWIARRFEDPTFKRTFTHFGTVQYWQREVQDLREQIARIDEANTTYYN